MCLWDVHVRRDRNKLRTYIMLDDAMVYAFSAMHAYAICIDGNAPTF